MGRCLPLLLMLCLVAGCRRQEDRGAIGVSLIVPAHVGRSDPPPPALAQATESGLVRIDRDGQVVAGAAVRWAILEDGLDYIFRIDDATGVSAATAARRLNLALRRSKSDRIKALAGGVESVQAVTATVVELRLSAPQPDLLPLLARPEMAIGAPGPLRRTATPNGLLLVPRSASDPDARPVRLYPERVGRAVARFAAEQVDVVLGGTFKDLPVARAAQPRKRELRFDPAIGLFGFVPHDANSAFAAPAVREALSMAIDRDRIVAAIGAPDLAKATTLGGSTLELPLAERRDAARAALAGGTLPPLRVGMPDGPGARLLFALVAQDWRSIGVSAVAVGPDAAADLKLIDVVAPAGSRAALACAASSGCNPDDRLALLAPPYIPLASPVRWALVSRKIDHFSENALATHPLDQLR